MMNRSFWLVALLVAALTINYVSAHSYLTSPVSRTNQRETQTGCRGPACLGPCDAPASRARAPIQIRRGDPINLLWPRNNHAAGFIRVAWAATSESDSHAAFDAGVQSYSCHETGRVAGGACAPASASLPNGGDANPSDGSRGACTRSLTVPNHLPNGRYTLQWAWFGGAFNLGDYYSCVDYEIVGGSEGSKQAAIFDGGDFSNPQSGPNGMCKYFNTRSLRVCVNEACFNGKDGNGNGRPAAISGGGSTPVVTATAAPSTPVPTAKPATPAPATPAPATPAPATPAPARPATPVPVPVTPGAGSADMSVAYSLTDKWATGLAASVRATAKKAMSSWTLSFKIGSSMKLASIWNCQLVSQTNNGDGTATVLVRNPSWQTSVAAGQVLEIGFTANFPAGNTPSVNANGFALSTGSRAEDSAESSESAAGASQHEEAASSGLSTVAAIGIAVGGSAGVAAMIAGVIIARKKMQAKNRAASPEVIQFSHVATESPSVSTH